ncbi:MAG: hypothetical protein HYY52_00070 [Candidatus Melainabacteria bacterium]|nr:hypothetical protein [Candidatus Melainabacteria bacterium]
MVTPSTKIKKQESSINYYAGFSHTFVEHAIKSSNINEKTALILDPWNGSGMTTSVAYDLGYKSIGIDINEATLIYSYARLADYSVLEESLKYVSTWKDIGIKSVSPFDFLWFTKESTQKLSVIRNKILALRKPIIRNFLSYIAIKAFRKQLIDYFSSNPTWIKRPKNDDDLSKFNFEEWIEECRSSINHFYEQNCSKRVSRSVLPLLRTGSSLALPIRSGSIDCIITSPPYCTRIDYAVMTLPELVWLGYDNNKFNVLRRNLIGTPTVRILYNSFKFSSRIKNLLHRIKSHNSKASASYYYKTFHDYFYNMEKSFDEIDRVLKSKGALHIVLQDSMFKDIDVNLSKIFSESLENRGFTILDESRFMAAGFNYIKGNANINEVVFKCQKML